MGIKNKECNKIILFYYATDPNELSLLKKKTFCIQYFNLFSGILDAEFKYLRLRAHSNHWLLVCAIFSALHSLPLTHATLFFFQCTPPQVPTFPELSYWEAAKANTQSLGAKTFPTLQPHVCKGDAAKHRMPHRL